MGLTELQASAIMALHRLAVDAAVEHHALWVNAAGQQPSTPRGRLTADHQPEVLEGAYDARLTFMELRDYVTSLRAPWDSTEDRAEDDEEDERDPEQERAPLVPRAEPAPSQGAPLVTGLA